jgi:T3SS negative regulator,GrlR
MDELDGKYDLKFAGVVGRGEGVAIFAEGEVYGIDERRYYIGKYRLLSDGRMRAQLSVRHHSGEPDTVLGNELASFTLDLVGERLDPLTIRLEGIDHGVGSDATLKVAMQCRKLSALSLERESE